MFNVLNKIVGFINQSIAVTGISAGVVIAFVNVVARYVFDASLTWATELTVFLFLWSAFFGAAYCFKKDAHIAVTIIIDLIPSHIAKYMLLLSHIVTLVFLLAVSYYGYEYLLLVIELEEVSIDLGIPMWIPYLAIPAAFLLAAYRVTEKIVHIIITPHNEVIRESEAETIMASMGEAGKDHYHEDEKEALDDLVKTAEKKTGGML